MADAAASQTFTPRKCPKCRCEITSRDVGCEACGFGTPAILSVMRDGKPVLAIYRNDIALGPTRPEDQQYVFDLLMIALSANFFLIPPYSTGPTSGPVGQSAEVAVAGGDCRAYPPYRLPLKPQVL